MRVAVEIYRDGPEREVVINAVSDVRVVSDVYGTGDKWNKEHVFDSVYVFIDGVHASFDDLTDNEQEEVRWKSWEHYNEREANECE